MVELAAEEEIHVGLHGEPREFDVTRDFVGYYSVAMGCYYARRTGGPSSASRWPRPCAACQQGR